MCLILVGWQAHPDFPLVVAANRDEFHRRPTAPLSFWPDAPDVLAGQDLEAGGTWLGITRSGRFAAVTNVREPGAPGGKCSRGALTAGFLRSNTPAAAFSHDIAGHDYAGFNLLLADRQALYYVSNRSVSPTLLAPGIYGLSNHRLDTPWPKLTKAKAQFADALSKLPGKDAESAFFALLADRSTVTDDELPSTGVPLPWERLLSAIFVQSPDYGTRASTLVLRRPDGSALVIEKSFTADGLENHASRMSTAV